MKDPDPLHAADLVLDDNANQFIPRRRQIIDADKPLQIFLPGDENYPLFADSSGDEATVQKRRRRKPKRNVKKNTKRGNRDAPNTTDDTQVFVPATREIEQNGDYQSYPGEWEMPASYIRYIPASLLQSQEQIEYEMDDEDHDFLEKYNATASAQTLSEDDFERIMHGLEETAFAFRFTGDDAVAALINPSDVTKCDVCDNPGVILAGKGDSASYDDEHSLISCSQCALTVHECCYGELSVQEREENEWLCEVCQEMNTQKKGRKRVTRPSCVLCGHSEGAMKALASDKKRFAHILCALWSPRIGFRVDEALKQPSSECRYCHSSKGMTTQCSIKQCSTVCDGKDAIVFSAKCKKHSREDMEEWQEEKEKEKRFVRLQERLDGISRDAFKCITQNMRLSQRAFEPVFDHWVMQSVCLAAHRASRKQKKGAMVMRLAMLEEEDHFLFSRHEEKRQKRNVLRNMSSEELLERLSLLRVELDRSRMLLAMTRRREILKRSIVETSIDLFREEMSEFSIDIHLDEEKEDMSDLGVDDEMKPAALEVGGIEPGTGSMGSGEERRGGRRKRKRLIKGSGVDTNTASQPLVDVSTPLHLLEKEYEGMGILRDERRTRTRTSGRKKVSFRSDSPCSSSEEEEENRRRIQQEFLEEKQRVKLEEEGKARQRSLRSYSQMSVEKNQEDRTSRVGCTDAVEYGGIFHDEEELSHRRKRRREHDELSSSDAETHANRRSRSSGSRGGSVKRARRNRLMKSTNDVSSPSSDSSVDSEIILMEANAGYEAEKQKENIQRHRRVLTSSRGERLVPTSLSSGDRPNRRNSSAGRKKRLSRDPHSPRVYDMYLQAMC